MNNYYQIHLLIPKLLIAVQIFYYHPITYIFGDYQYYIIFTLLLHCEMIFFYCELSLKRGLLEYSCWFL